jgi:DNA-binding NarL/FixJ family response regulator
MRAELAYAMTEAEIAAELGLSKAAVKTILHRAMAKIRARPELCARFRAAVEENRRALDARWMSGWMSKMASERIQ